MAVDNIRKNKKQACTFMSAKDEGATITPSLQIGIENALAEYKTGKYTRLTTHEDIDKYFESL
jgi:hypothetical protein